MKHKVQQNQMTHDDRYIPFFISCVSLSEWILKRFSIRARGSAAVLASWNRCCGWRDCEIVSERFPGDQVSSIKGMNQ